MTAMSLTKFEASHWKWLMQQPGCQHLAAAASDSSLRILENSRHSWTIISLKGWVMACGGVVEYWGGRGEAWVTLNRNPARTLADTLGTQRLIRFFLEECPFRRIEAAVEIDFRMGHRWVQALGFQLEAPCLRRYSPEGNDCSLYARIK